VAFDLLAVAGHDIREVVWSRRRELLEELARTWVPPLNLSPATTDRELAEEWFRNLPSTGLEGLVINSLLNERVDGVHEGGMWLPMSGRVRIVGRSAPLSARAGTDLAKNVRPPGGASVAGGNQLDWFNKESGSVRLTNSWPCWEWFSR
jgi:hypothetical protein